MVWSGADPGFQVRGGAHLKKLFWVFRMNNHDFTPKIICFQILWGGGWGGGASWIRPCPRDFTNQWWRQIRRPFICHFAIWLFFTTSGLQSHFAHCCSHYSNVAEQHLLRFNRCVWVNVKHWFDILRLREMKSISLQHFIWWSYRFSGAMLCCLVQPVDNEIVPIHR
jgi:hypothetical protein